MRVSKYGQITYEEEANKLFPDGCTCGPNGTPGNNTGGDCDWCQVYYAFVCPACGSDNVDESDEGKFATCEDCGHVQYDAETLALQSEVKREQVQAKAELGYIPTYAEWQERQKGGVK